MQCQGEVSGTASWFTTQNLIYQRSAETAIICVAQKNTLRAIACKVADDVSLSHTASVVDPFIRKTNNSFTLGTALHGPGQLRFFNINITQQKDCSVTIDADEKLENLDSYRLSRKFCHEVDKPLTFVELKSFVLLNRSLCWIGYHSSVFYSALASRLQQKASEATVRDLLEQQRGLRKVNRLGILVCYKNVQDILRHAITVEAFSDAGKNMKMVWCVTLLDLCLIRSRMALIFTC